MPRAGVRRRALSLTPLVDVIFLLLLFFMLSSTFSRFGEIPLTAAGGAAGGEVVTGARFLRVGPGTISLAGRDIAEDELAAALSGERVLMTLATGVTAQRLVDILSALRAAPGISLMVVR